MTALATTDALFFGLEAFGDVMDDGVEQLALADIDGAAEALHMADRPVGPAVIEEKVVALGAAGPQHDVCLLYTSRCV